MATKKPRDPQRAAHDEYKKNVRKLQKAGLLGPVDFRKKASKPTIAAISRYRNVLSGKAATVQAPDAKTAARLRKQLGLTGKGKTLVIPREKGERYAYQKSTGEVVSKRPGFERGTTIKKTLGAKFPAHPPTSDKRLYYTIPERTRGAGVLRRKTFSSFNEFLHYIQSYDVEFEDIEDRLEIEEVEVGSNKDKIRQKKIADERAAAYRRYKRKKRKSHPKRRKPRSGKRR